MNTPTFKNELPTREGLYLVRGNGDYGLITVVVDEDDNEKLIAYEYPVWYNCTPVEFGEDGFVEDAEFALVALKED